MRVFVTGATGVIGRRLVPLLLSAGHDVTAVVRDKHKGTPLWKIGASPRQLSLFAPVELHRAVAGHDAVVNLATHVPDSAMRMLVPGTWRTNDHLRREGAANLVDAALDAGVTRFVQESYAPIYVDHGNAWIDEDWPVHPARYNRSVLDAESSARRFTRSGGTGIVLRFGAFYGPDAGQLVEMIRVVRHGWGPLLGPAASYVSSVSHDDAASAVLAALEAPAGVYNVTDDQPLSHRAYVDALADAVGVARPHLVPAWMAHFGGSFNRLMARSQRISNRKLRELGTWAPRYPSVREGFRAAVARMDFERAHGHLHLH
jgi:nucleoside-diphosphate-sugar epimerase